MSIGAVFKTEAGTSISIILTEEGSLAFWQHRQEVEWYFNLPYEYYKHNLYTWVEQ